MKLIPDARKVARSAWSVRFAALSAAFSALELALPYLTGIVPAKTMAALALVAGIGSAVARVIAQPAMHGGGE